MVAVTFDTNGLFIFTENAGITGDTTAHAGTRTAVLTDDNTYMNPGIYSTTFSYTPDPQNLPGSIHVFLGDPTPIMALPAGTTGPVKIDFSVVDRELDFLLHG